MKEMAERAPKNEEELSEVNGVGQAKLAKYGAPFLAIVAEFVPKLRGAVV